MNYYGCLSNRNVISINKLPITICLFLFGLACFCSFPSVSLAQSGSGPLGDLPSVTDFLGDPEDFVKSIEAKVFPVLGQFFAGLATTYALSASLKAFMRK